MELGATRASTERVVAVAGDRCCCIVHVTNFEHRDVSEMLLLQFDHRVERLRRLVAFDLDDLDDALAELERLHAEAEADES